VNPIVVTSKEALLFVKFPPIRTDPLPKVGAPLFVQSPFTVKVKAPEKVIVPVSWQIGKERFLAKPIFCITKSRAKSALDPLVSNFWRNSKTFSTSGGKNAEVLLINSKRFLVNCDMSIVPPMPNNLN